MTSLLVTGARIWTYGQSAEATTLLVDGGRFVFVGSEHEISPPANATKLDLRGQRVLPGLTDSHVHLLGTGYAMTSVGLKGVSSAEEAARLVAERAMTTPAGSWITGAGWDLSLIHI
jgi:predicted amidohydrolase YtcJ